MTHAADTFMQLVGYGCVEENDQGARQIIREGIGEAIDEHDNRTIASLRERNRRLLVQNDGLLKAQQELNQLRQENLKLKAEIVLLKDRVVDECSESLPCSDCPASDRCEIGGKPD